MKFTLDQFVVELRAALGERSRLAIKDVVARAVSQPDGVLRELGEPDKSGVQVLHRSPELTVLNVVWSPNQVTLPHDHRMTAVIGMYGGREDNMFWRRVPEARRFQIEPAGGEALGTGDVALLGRDIVHSVINPLSRLSAAIHVYDGPFLTIERSMWDAESLTEQRYDVNAVAKGMAVQAARPDAARAGV
jgi:predicted metal-dependent enzyme (double-stranded beta helix superfamily)